MKKYLIILVVLVSGLKSWAQEPIGFPTQFNTGWQQWGYQQSIKGTIIATRDTLWVPRFCGTMVLWPHAGVDTAYWMWNCVRWKKIASASDASTITWGNITGTLSNQTDLQNALNLKFNTSDTANKWVQDVYSRNDSLFKFKNGTETFIDTLGGGGSATSPAGSDTWVQYNNAGVFGAESVFNYNQSTNRLSVPKIISSSGTLSDGEVGISFFATQPTTITGSQAAMNISVTSAGSSGENNMGLRLNYNPGYTGAGITYGGSFSNSVSGTANLLIPSSGNNTQGNLGINGVASGITTGLNVGVQGGAGSGNVNAGIAGISQTTKNSATNIGVAGSAINGGTSSIQVGGWFSLNQTTVPTQSAALIADNGAQTSHIFRAKDNGVDVFSIADGGNVTMVAPLVAIDTTTYKVMVKNSSGDVRTLNWPIFGGGGGPGTVTQVNSGYGLLGGPITTTGTLIVDTSINGVATLYNVNNLGRTYPDEHRWGTIYEKNTWTTLSDFTPQGTSNVALSGGYVNITAATEDYTPVVRVLRSRPTGLTKWKMTFQYRVTAWSASTNWFGPILKSLVTHSGANFGYMAFTGVSSSGGGNSFILDEDGTILVNGGAGPTKSLNDLMEATFERNDTTLTYTIRNVTTSSATQTVNYTFPQNHSVILPNVGTWGFMYNATSAGNIRLEYLKIESDETMNPNVLCVGDSKTAIGFADNYAGRWPAQLNPTFPTVTYSAGSAEYVTDALLKISEITQSNPEKVILGFIGENDIRDGVPFATVTTNMRRLYNSYADGNTDVYWICLPEDSTAGGVGLSNLKEWVKTTFPNNYIETWDSLSTNNVLDGIYDSGDGVHLNQAGMDKIVQTILASNKLTTVSVYRRTPFNATDGIIKTDGDSLWFNYPISPVASNIPKFDDSYNIVGSNVWDNGTAVIVSSTLNPTAPIGGILFNVNGTIATYGNTGGVYILDRDNPAKSTALYGNAGVTRINRNGNDIGGINDDGKLTLGFPSDFMLAFGALRIKKDYSFPAAQNTRGFALNVDTATFTTSAATNLGNGAVVSIAPATFVGSSSAYDNLASLYIEKGPIAGSSMTITNSWALNINGGRVRMAGLDSAGSPANALWINPNTGELLKGPAGSGGSYTFTNGLTESGGTAKWGGTLSEFTNINGAGTYGVSMGQTISKLTSFSVNVNNSGYIQFFGAMQYAAQSVNTSASTDIYYITKLDPIASDQNFTLGTGSGKAMLVIDSNNTAFNWNFTGAIVKDDNGNAVTTSNPGVTQLMHYVNGVWHISYSGMPKEISSSAGSLTLIPHSRTYSFSGTTTTWTLPALTNTVGRRYYIKNRGSGNITLNSNAGGNDIYDTSATNTITISAGTARIIENDGTYWVAQ
jgi:hypothetical protein